MFRWAGRLRVVLILPILMFAIYAPVVVSGYMDIGRGDAALRHGDYVARTMQTVPTDDYASAAQYYASAAKKLPWKRGLWDLAAHYYAAARDWDHAMPLFAIGRNLGVLTARSWDEYGGGYALEGRYEEAVRLWKEGLRHYPNEAIFYESLAWDDRRRNDFAAEEQDLSIFVASGLARLPKLLRPSYYYRLGELLLASNPDQARADLRRVASMEPAYSAVVQTLTASLALADLEPNPSRRLVIIGRGLGLVNDWPLAQYDFQQAVSADSQNAEAWAWLGEAQQQNKQDGKVALDKALELDPNSSLVHGLRGLYWKRQGKPKAALAEYQAAAKLEPKNAEWQAALGDAYASTGDLVQALAAYVTATDLAPDNATYWRLLALFSADNGIQVQDIGLPAAKKAVEIAPNDPQVLDALGWTYAQAGLLNTAEQTLNKAIKIAPDSASAHLHLAETYLREGQASFAQSELNRVVQLDPNGSYGTFAASLLKQYFP